MSADFAAVLERYAVWQQKSGGAFNSQVGELVREWKAGERANREPDAAALERIVNDLKGPGWTLDARARTVTRRTVQPLDLNAVAKGYMIRKAADAVRAAHPTVTALLANLGGDIFAWGDRTWAVGVQDPANHFDNAAPLFGGLGSSPQFAAPGPLLVPTGPTICPHRLRRQPLVSKRVSVSINHSA